MQNNRSPYGDIVDLVSSVYWNNNKMGTALYLIFEDNFSAYSPFRLDYFVCDPFFYLISRYLDGERLEFEDEKIVIEKLLAYHPYSKDKIGCGLDFIMVRNSSLISLFLYPLIWRYCACSSKSLGSNSRTTMIVR